MKYNKTVADSQTFLRNNKCVKNCVLPFVFKSNSVGNYLTRRNGAN